MSAAMGPAVAATADPAVVAAAREHIHEPATASEADAKTEALRAKSLDAIGPEALAQFEWALQPMMRGAKWDVEKAAGKMETLAKFAAKHPRLFEGLSPDAFLPLAEIGMMTPLPTRNNRGELVILLRMEKLDDFCRSFTMTDMLRFSVFYMGVMVKEEATQLHGVVMLEDLANMSMFAMMRLKGFGPSAMKANFDWLYASPMRLRDLYACHAPWFVGLMLAMVKPFMKKKLRDRVEIYDKDTANMLDSAGLKPEQVPPAFGGTLDLDHSWYVKEMVGRT